MKELWVEKYRPKDVDGYVFRDEHQKRQVQQWIKDGTIPHLLFSGNANILSTICEADWLEIGLPVAGE